MAPAPIVSVITAVRDGQEWLPAAVESVLAQAFSDFEFLIVDDGSQDQTPNILAKYSAGDPRVIAIRQEREGVVYALNRGLARAKGEYIARLDADDVALPGRLQRQVGYLNEHPGIVLLGTWAQVIDEQGRIRRLLQAPTDPQTLSRLLPRTNPFVNSSAMFRTAAARALGCYRTPFETAEDYDLWLRLSEIGEVAILPEVLTQYREHGTNATKIRAIRQILSTRLAKRGAEARRQTGHDPCSALSAPPDWHVVDDKAFYADDAKLCRVLEMADPAVAGKAAPETVELDVVSSRLAELTHREKKLAQLAVINLMRARAPVPGYSKRALFALLFRLHPTRALRLLWRAP